MILNSEQKLLYQQNGYFTLEGVFSHAMMDQAIAEAHKWQDEYFKDLNDDEKNWYVDQTTELSEQLRKLDNPVSKKRFFKELALSPQVLPLIQDLIGKEVMAFFSQIFFKPPYGGGPKPVHQDNFYFGPDNPDGIITLWIAFDPATVENGCLYYGSGTNRHGVVEHFAPPEEPFNYQIPVTGQVEMTAAPVGKGGISLHHGCTFHQSSSNKSGSWRRAMAVHYLHRDVKLTASIFTYETEHYVKAF